MAFQNDTVKNILWLSTALNNLRTTIPLVFQIRVRDLQLRHSSNDHNEVTTCHAVMAVPVALVVMIAKVLLALKVSRDVLEIE